MALVDKIQKIPVKARVGGFLAFVGVIVTLFIWQVHIPKTTQIKQLEKDIQQLASAITENDEKIRKLDELRAEVKDLKEQLKLLTEQLPPESEVSGLLRQVQNLVNQSGLSLKLWKPEKRKTHSSGMYEEIPITLELNGGYHNVGVFFDMVSKLTRIVNMLNVKMGNAELDKNGVLNIKINCTAMTFAAVEKKVETKAPQAKKTR